jgi:seryl-tRNA synthetase
MLDIKFIKENKEVVEAAIANKKVLEKVNLDELLSLYEQKKEIQSALDENGKQRNDAARERNIEVGTRLKAEAADIEEKLREIEKQYMRLMLLLPNVPSADTPIGPDESANKVVRSWGDIPTFAFKPKEHFELGEALGIIDTETAAIVSGSRFAYLKGDLALMQFALIQLAMEALTTKDILETIKQEAGLDLEVAPFIPVVPPVFIKPAVFNRMARLEPRDERYYIESDDLYLIGSAEHTLGPMHMDHVFKEEELPLRYVGYSTAFRREAGTYGKDMKGILRVHQFDKVEMEIFSLPENSYKEQDFTVAIQEYLLRKLNIPHQVVLICTGDMGLPDHRQIDVECFMPGQDKYRETHSSDLIAGFQPRRLNTRVKRTDGNIEHVHMTDATVLAIGRTLIAIMENNQQEDGSILIPDVLQKYMGGKTVIRK